MKFRVKTFAQLFSMIIVDLFAYYVAAFLALFIQMNLGSLLNFQFIFERNMPEFWFNFLYLLSIWWIPIAYIIVLQFEKLYGSRYPFWEETRIIVKAVSIAILFITMTVIVRNMYLTISRSFFFFLWLVLMFVLPVFRYIGKRLLYKIGLWKESVLIIGAGDRAVSAIQGISKEDHLGYHVVGLIDEQPFEGYRTLEVKGREYKVYGNIKNIEKFIHLLKIETVFIASSDISQDEITLMVNEIYKHVKRVLIIPDIHGVAIFNSELQYLFMERLFMIKVNNNLNSGWNMVIKRIFDLGCSMVGLILISPLLAVIALAVKLTSPGRIIYAHTRIGKNGKEFKALKFRTMYSDSAERLKHILATDPEAKKEWEESYKLRNDPRITLVGKLLRRTSLDELPQIFNIIRGEMSLVGPRPVIRDEIEKYYGSYSEYYYSVLPGLSGLWQVSGRSDTNYDFRIQTDVWYVQNWSLWLDIIILFKTFAVVLRREGAY